MKLSLGVVFWLTALLAWLIPVYAKSPTYPQVIPISYEALQAPPRFDVPVEATSTILRRYFAGKWQIFESLAGCESTKRQFYPGGGIVTSPVNWDSTFDHGYLQINDKNIPEAKALGLDVFNSLEDNIHMASIIYARQGYWAWVTCARKQGLLPIPY